MTAAAIATMATVEAATITNCLLSRRTRKKPSGRGDITSLMARWPRYAVSTSCRLSSGATRTSSDEQPVTSGRAIYEDELSELPVDVATSTDGARANTSS